MRAKLIPIGNSKGMRIPKALIEQCGLGEEVEIDAREGGLLVRAVPTARRGWEKAFARMRRLGDDQLLDAESVAKPTDWEAKEWTW